MGSFRSRQDMQSKTRDRAKLAQAVTSHLLQSSKLGAIQKVAGTFVELTLSSELHHSYSLYSCSLQGSHASSLKYKHTHGATTFGKQAVRCQSCTPMQDHSQPSIHPAHYQSDVEKSREIPTMSDTKSIKLGYQLFHAIHPKHKRQSRVSVVKCRVGMSAFQRS